MLQPVSVALKFGLLAVLYLFLVWVVWSAFRDLRRGSTVVTSNQAPPPDSTGLYAAADGLGDGHLDELEPRLLVERAIGHPAGVAYEIPDAGAVPNVGLRAQMSEWADGRVVGDRRLHDHAVIENRHPIADS